MTVAISKLTKQGQISVPAEIRRRLGLGPGSVLEWEDTGGEVVVRRAGRFSSTDVHEYVFGKPSTHHDLSDLKEGIRARMKKKYEKR